MGYAEAVMAPRINQRLGGKLELETGFSKNYSILILKRAHKPTSHLLWEVSKLYF
ncbi:MAG: hypothetical protein Ct9H300mP20_17750 [Gammaproteobacteria bacterium]|nr:MAG: hypothetical protein Ct9H300mP20_17750 [Gammaproteobacteria bacterium]